MINLFGEAKTGMSKMGDKLEWILDTHKYEMYEALQKIAEGKGRFSRDPLTHCSNTVEDLRQLASEVLAKIEQG